MEIERLQDVVRTLPPIALPLHDVETLQRGQEVPRDVHERKGDDRRQHEAGDAETVPTGKWHFRSGLHRRSPG